VRTERVRERERERVGERYVKETLIDIAQTNIA